MGINLTLFDLIIKIVSLLLIFTFDDWYFYQKKKKKIEYRL